MRARLLGPLLIALVGALLLPSGAAAAKSTDCTGADVAVSAANVASAERSLHCLVNVYRVANGLQPLTEEPALARAARGHSDYMERTDQFAHRDIGDGTPSERAKQAGFACDFDCVGENIAYSSRPGITPRNMFEQWRNSPGHNANMLGADYLSAGMGFAFGPNHGVTGTQVFAVVANGATSTAADMLTSPACEGDRAALATAQAKLDTAKAKVKSAKSAKKKKKARKKLKKAKAAAQDQASAAATSCALTY